MPLFSLFSHRFVYSAGVLSELNNVAALVFIFVMPGIKSTWVNTIMLGTTALCFLCVCCAREKYSRTSLDESDEDGVDA